MTALLLELRPLVQLGLLTDGYISVQQRKVTALGLASYFDVIIYSDAFGRTHWKPSVIPYQAALHNLNIEARRAVYIGDNPQKDFVGAKRVGISTVWARYIPGDYFRLASPSSDYAADFTCDYVSDLRQLLLPDC
jgi:putative hydrolase of the HAD superfamily